MQFNRQFLIIAKSQIASSWKRLLVPRYGSSAVKTLELPTVFFEKDHFDDWHQLKQYFNQIVAKLGEYKIAADLRNLVVIIPVFTELPIEKDNPINGRWDPCFYKEKKTENKSSNNNPRYYRELVFSWLILAFPEVRFVFLSEENKGKKSLVSHPEQLHLIPMNDREPDTKDEELETAIDYLRFTDFPVLFDPSGLRDSIRKMLNPPRPRHPGVWRRYENAVVLEDEMTYSYYCGYAAYRHGCKTWIAQNYRQAENLLKEQNTKTKFTISLEDLALGFPDKEAGISLSDLREYEGAEKCGREKHLPLLKSIARRCIVTYGGARRSDSDKSLQGQVRDYNSRNGSGSIMKIIYKPLPDLFTLGRKTGLYRIVWRNARHLNAQKLRQHYESGTPHSAEGILVDIAEILIKRTKRLLWEKTNVMDLVQAALLSLEAKELLGGKTPTLSLEALGLQHRSEVTAECISHGTDYDLDVSSRAKEIRKEVKLITLGYRAGTSRKLAELGASSMILGDLSGIYSHYKQIEEYEHSLIETRYLSGLSFFYRHPLTWPLYPVRLYFEFLLKSLRHFLFAVVCWFTFLLVLWGWYFAQQGQPLSEIAYAIFNNMFFRGIPDWMKPMQNQWGTRLLTATSMLINWTHVGILIGDAIARVRRR